MKTRIKNTPKMGRGIFAERDINEGDIVEVSPCLVFNKKDEWTIQETELKMYVFSDERGGSVLALGIGSLFNHSKRPNVTYFYNNNTNTVVFTATRKISKGTQLFINYGYDPVAKRKRWVLEQKGRNDAELMSQQNISHDPVLPCVPLEDSKLEGNAAGG